MRELRLLDPDGFTVPGTVVTVPTSRVEAEKARLLEMAPADAAAPWRIHPQDPAGYRVQVTDPAAAAARPLLPTRSRRAA